MKFIFIAGIFLELLLFLMWRLSTAIFIYPLHPQGGLEGFAVIYFWFFGTILTVIIGTIVISLAAVWYRRKYQDKESLNKYILLSWFSFFAFLSITIIGFVTITIIHTIFFSRLPKAQLERPQVKNNPSISPTPPDLYFTYPTGYFKSVNYYDEISDWRPYEFALGQRDKAESNIKMITLQLPDEVSTAEEYVYDPYKSLVIRKDRSVMYIGDPFVFSTSGNLYCIDCQYIGTIKVKLLGKIADITLVHELYHLSREEKLTNYITKLPLHNYFSSCPSNCWHDISIQAASIDDFFLFLKIIETIKEKS